MSAVPETTTRWTLVRMAVEGSTEHREVFGKRYQPLIRSYFRHRWGSWPIAQEIDDAVQDVFVECFRPEGPLARAEPGRGLRLLLRGVARNVARRYEERACQRRPCTPEETSFLSNLPAEEARLSQAFDRKWAEAILVEALHLARQHAAEAGPDASRRYELLKLRFEDGLPIRAIAARWELPAREVHDAYAQARREFYRALRDVVASHEVALGRDLEVECKKLLSVLE